MHERVEGTGDTPDAGTRSDGAGGAGTPPAGTPTTPEPPARRRRRWPKVLLAFLVLLLGAVALAPLYLRPVVRAQVVKALSERVDGTVELDAVVIGWDGSAQLRGLRVARTDGEPLLELASAAAHVDLGALLGGHVGFDARVTEGTAWVRRDREGRWELQDLLRTDEAGAAGGAADDGDAPEAPGTDGPPPSVHGELVFEDLRVEVLLDTDAGPRAGWQEVSGRVDLDLAHETVTVSELALLGLIEGQVAAEVSGLLGAPHADRLDVDLRYTPDEVAPLLEGFLPEDSDLVLSGATPQPLRFTFAGPLDATTLEQVLGGATTSGRVGIGQLSLLGNTLTGELALDGGSSVAQVEAGLTLDGGAFVTTAQLDLSGETPSAHFGTTLDAVPVGGSLRPLLARVHPAFAGAQQLGSAQLDGLVHATLDLRWDGPLPLAAPEGGWADLDATPLSGKVRLEVTDATLRDSPLLGQLAQLLGGDPTRAFGLKPLEFTLERGAISYDGPWTWNVAGIDTRFVGGIGVDGSLDLAWEVPITEAVAARKDELSALVGETLRVPLGGSLRSPKLQWQPAVEALAKGMLERRATEEVNEELEGLLDKAGVDREVLDGVLEGDLQKGLDAILKGGADEILREADKLWDAGKKTEAAELYKTLRNKHSLTPTYLLNKSRIKARQDG